MDFRHLKKLGTVSAIALALVLGVQPAKADTSTTVATTFSTAAALASATGTTMDFGTWVIDIQSAETITLPLLASLAPPPPVPVPGGVTNSVVTNTVVPTNSGTFTVTAPIVTTLQINGTVSTDFADASLSLGTLIYTDTVVTNAALPAAYGGDVVTIVAGGVAETVAVGATLTLSGANPAEATTFADAIVTVNLRY